MKTNMGNWVRTALLLAAVLGVQSAPEDTRIVGGVSVDIEDYPYQVSLQYDETHYCGGSIIANNWVLTAAHCVLDSTYDQTKITVRVGSTSWKSGGTVYKVTSMTPHQKYTKTPSTQYDMALLKMSAPIAYGTGVQPITLADAGTTVAGNTDAVVSGWGRLNSTNLDLPTQLQALHEKIVDLATCKSRWNPIEITDVHICAVGKSTGGEGGCMGDSGGPFMVLVSGAKVLQGVVSFGNPCAVANYPDVYARVANSELRSWIKTISGV